MMKWLLAIAAILLAAVPAAADVGGTWTAYPTAVITVAVANTYQQILPATAGRRGCSIPNNTGHVIFVYPDIAANANTATTASPLNFQVPAGQSFYCQVFGQSAAISNAISVTTGTIGDQIGAWYE